MENFESSIAIILEVETVKPNDELQSFDTWDSLTILSIIAFCDEEYDVALSESQITASKTVQGLKDLVINRV